MPIERYVINFLQEVPLPPLGRVDVRYFMPNNLKMTLSRPPPNKLPMTDFSYRPLFASLSVENIIIVFQCLCAELTVCICSDNLSLLTPVQEAFLSFLFPLVWQGKTHIDVLIVRTYVYSRVSMSIHPSIHLSMNLSIHTSIHTCIHTFMRASIYAFVL
jgi:DENN (AEX-3) domain